MQTTETRLPRRIRKLIRQIDNCYASGNSAKVENLECRLEQKLEWLETNLQGLDENDDADQVAECPDSDAAEHDSCMPDPAAELVNTWHRFQQDRQIGQSYPDFVRKVFPAEGRNSLQPNTSDAMILAATAEVIKDYSRRHTALQTTLINRPIFSVQHHYGIS